MGTLVKPEKTETITSPEASPGPDGAVLPAPGPRTEGRAGLRLGYLLHIGVLAAFTLLAIIATWPMFPQLGGFVMDKGDPLYSVWAMAWQAHALVTDPLRMFDANN